MEAHPYVGGSTEKKAGARQGNEMSTIRNGHCSDRSTAARPEGHNRHRFQTIGLYVIDLAMPPSIRNFHRCYDFFKACGYNHLELLDHYE